MRRGILGFSHQGSNLVPPALKAVPTTGSPEKTLEEQFYKRKLKSEIEPNKTHRYEKQSLSQILKMGMQFAHFPL